MLSTLNAALVLFCRQTHGAHLQRPALVLLFFFFNDTATTEIYTLSLHDALPISARARRQGREDRLRPDRRLLRAAVALLRDRKSTRLNSSHGYISYAVSLIGRAHV